MLLSTALLISGCGLLNKRLPGAGPNPNDIPPPGVATNKWSGAVVADEPQAALVARSILAAGGNAADAATALGFALMVTLPSRASLGGGGACLAYSPFVKNGKNNRPQAFVFMSPAASGGGSRAAAVPMTARGLLLMQAIYGTKPIDQLIGPAQRLASLGVPVSQTLEADLSVVSGPLFGDPVARSTFGDASGAPLAVGQTMVQPDLADTLNILRVKGISDLYQGDLAQSLARGSAMAGGPISLEDLANAVPQQMDPIDVEAGGNRATFLPPPADGGLAAAGAFAELRAHEGDAAGANAAALAIATAYRAGTDRDNPAALLTEPNLPRGALPELAASTSFVTLDQYGDAVACALTMNNLFGTGRIAPGTGILLAASPAHGQTPLLAASLVWNKPTNSFRAAVGGTGQQGAPLAVALTADYALRRGGRDFGTVVPDPGRANAINCPDRVPGNFKSCIWLTDPRGAGMATGKN